MVEAVRVEDQVADMRVAMAAMAARLGIFEDAARPGSMPLDTIFHDRKVAAKASELLAYRQWFDRIYSALQHNRALLQAQFPDMDLQWFGTVLHNMGSLDRLLALHMGALSIAQSKGWPIYTQYTANLRPYAANPPDNWRNFDFSILDPRQLKLATEMVPAPSRQHHHTGSVSRRYPQAGSGKRKGGFQPGSSSKHPRNDGQDGK
jgi:hypothetical protein